MLDSRNSCDNIEDFLPSANEPSQPFFWPQRQIKIPHRRLLNAAFERSESVACECMISKISVIYAIVEKINTLYWILFMKNVNSSGVSIGFLNFSFRGIVV